MGALGILQQEQGSRTGAIWCITLKDRDTDSLWAGMRGNNATAAFFNQFTVPYIRFFRKTNDFLILVMVTCKFSLLGGATNQLKMSTNVNSILSADNATPKSITRKNSDYKPT
jgi:hypothetical protein